MTKVYDSSTPYCNGIWSSFTEIANDVKTLLLLGVILGWCWNMIAWYLSIAASNTANDVSLENVKSVETPDVKPLLTVYLLGKGQMFGSLLTTPNKHKTMLNALNIFPFFGD